MCLRSTNFVGIDLVLFCFAFFFPSAMHKQPQSKQIDKQADTYMFYMVGCLQWVSQAAALF